MTAGYKNYIKMSTIYNIEYKSVKYHTFYEFKTHSTHTTRRKKTHSGFWYSLKINFKSKNIFFALDLD